MKTPPTPPPPALPAFSIILNSQQKYGTKVPIGAFFYDGDKWKLTMLAYFEFSHGDSPFFYAIPADQMEGLIPYQSAENSPQSQAIQDHPMNTPTTPTLQEQLDDPAATIHELQERLENRTSSFLAALEVMGHEIARLKRENQALLSNEQSHKTILALINSTHREKIKSDSHVGACDCLTKTPEIEYHAPGCKYRLISERHHYKSELAKAESAFGNYRANINEALDDTCAPTHHPINPGAELPKPMMPQERIIALHEIALLNQTHYNNAMEEVRHLRQVEIALRARCAEHDKLKQGYDAGIELFTQIHALLSPGTHASAIPTVAYIEKLVERCALFDWAAKHIGDIDFRVRVPDGVMCSNPWTALGTNFEACIAAARSELEKATAALSPSTPPA